MNSNWLSGDWPGGFVAFDFLNFEVDFVEPLRLAIAHLDGLRFQQSTSSNHSVRSISKANARLPDLGAPLLSFVFVSSKRLPNKTVGFLSQYGQTKQFSLIVEPTDENSDRVQSLISHAISMAPTYGYRFTESETSYPEFHVGGIGFGSDRRRHEKRITSLSAWSHAKNTPPPHSPFEIGMLRDVYEVNWINDAHLQAKVGSTTLMERIKLDPRFGSLSPSSSKLFSWNIDLANLAFVRERLKGSGLFGLDDFVWKVTRDKDLPGDQPANEFHAT